MQVKRILPLAFAALGLVACGGNDGGVVGAEGANDRLGDPDCIRVVPAASLNDALTELAESCAPNDSEVQALFIVQRDCDGDGRSDRYWVDVAGGDAADAESLWHGVPANFPLGC